MNVFKTILTGQHDMASAFCRDWVGKQTDENLLHLMQLIGEGTKHESEDNTQLVSYLAMFGLMTAMLAAEELKDDEQV